MKLGCQVLIGHFGPVYLLQVRKNNDEECLLLKVIWLYEMRGFLVFQFMVVLKLFGIPIHAVVVFEPEHDILFKSASTYCDSEHFFNLQLSSIEFNIECTL